jgi:hypothetical protein
LAIRELKGAIRKWSAALCSFHELSRSAPECARIDGMKVHYATVGAEGELEIPAEICESLGISGETCVALKIEGGTLILEPVIETLCDQHLAPV